MFKMIAMIILTLLPLMVPSIGYPMDSIVDLSHPLINNKTFHWPAFLPFEHRLTNFETGGTGENQYWIQSDEIHMASHTGTHVDGPNHFAKGKWSVGEIPLSHLIDRPVAVIDVREQSKADREYEMSVDDIIEWEKRNGKIPYDGVLLVRTGWARFWPNILNYIGTESKHFQDAHFPGVAPAAAHWLVDNRKIVGIGIDSASIDKGQTKKFEVHTTVMSENIYVIENVAQTINQLPEIGARLTALPLKIVGGSGVSVRLIARVPGNSKPEG